MLPVGAQPWRRAWDRRWCRWCVLGSLRGRSRCRMGRNAWCSALASGVHGCWHHEKRGSVDRARGWCSLSVHSRGGARGTVGGVAGAFFGLRGAGAGPGWVGTHGVPCWPPGFTAVGTTRNVGVAAGLVAGALCRCAAPEEHAGPSVVSLVRLVSLRGPSRSRMGRNAWCSVFASGVTGWRHHEET